MVGYYLEYHDFKELETTHTRMLKNKQNMKLNKMKKMKMKIKKKKKKRICVVYQ